MSEQITGVKQVKKDANTAFTHDFELTEYPFTRGKIIRFKDQEEAEKYRANSVTKDYVIIRIPGYNIFISFAGFVRKPTEYIDNIQVRKHITLMCNWYMLNVLHGNKVMANEYATKKLAK